MRSALDDRRTQAAARGIVEDLRGLVGALRDLWIVCATRLIESVAHFAIVNVLIVFASTIAGPIIALLFSWFIRAAERAKLAEARAEAEALAH